jgi:uncharacterized protein (TIGR00251 family)
MHTVWEQIVLFLVTVARDKWRARCVGVHDDGVGVQINAPATEGKANEELIDFMSEVLHTLLVLFPLVHTRCLLMPT